MAPTILERAGDSRRKVYVPMNQVDIAFWSEIDYLYTHSLNSCTGVSIVSPKAGILAHIPPRPSPNQSGDLNLRNMLQRVINLYNQNRQYFSQSRSIIVLGVWNNEPSSADQVRVVRLILGQLGLPIRAVDYNVLGVAAARPTGYTSMVIASNGDGHWPTVYVNEQAIGYH